MANRIFLDANVLLEVILGRPKTAAAQEIIKKHYGNLCISALTAHFVVYFSRKHLDLLTVEKFLKDYTILPFDEDSLTWAFKNYRDDDFEDAIQIGVALKNGCDRFLTFDKKLVKNYKTLPTLRVESV